MFRTHSVLSILRVAIAAIAAIATAGGAAQARSLPHNQIQSIRQDITNYQWVFQPHLKVSHGCVPFPAVDWWGNTNGGLRPTGRHNGECSGSSGQVYVRATEWRGECAVMYAWYFPKDLVIAGQGHRHDWENIVVWLSSCSMNAQVRAVAYSQHGKYSVTTRPFLRDRRPLVEYWSNGYMNHSLRGTSQVGGFQPAIRWYGLPFAARSALDNSSFGEANTPFSYKYFGMNIYNARYW